MSGIPVDSPYDYQLREAVDNWVKVHSGRLLNYVDDLKAAGYFNEWDSGRWKSTFFYDSENPYCIETDTIEDAIAYINYMHDTLLPELEAKTVKKLSRRSPILFWDSIIPQIWQSLLMKH